MSNQSVAGTPAQAVSAYFLLIRWVVTFHLVALAAQLALAISFVGGMASALPQHMDNGWTVAALGVAQAGLLLSTPAARLRGVHRLMAIAVVLGEVAQIYFATRLGVWLHVTTAMLIWAFSLTLAIKVWDPTWKHKA